MAYREPRVTCAHCHKSAGCQVCDNCSGLVCDDCASDCPNVQETVFQQNVFVKSGFFVTALSPDGKTVLLANKGHKRLILRVGDGIVRKLPRDACPPALTDNAIVVPQPDGRGRRYSRTLAILVGDGKTVVKDYNGDPVEIIVSNSGRQAAVLDAEGTVTCVDLTEYKTTGKIDARNLALSNAAVLEEFIERPGLRGGHSSPLSIECRVTAAAFGADGNIAVVGGSRIALYDATGQALSTEPEVLDGEEILWVGMAEEIVAITGSGRVWTGALDSGRLVGRYADLVLDCVLDLSEEDVEVGVRSVEAALCPNGRLLAVRLNSRPSVLVYDLSTARTWRLTGPPFAVTAIRFGGSPRGLHLWVADSENVVGYGMA